MTRPIDNGGSGDPRQFTRKVDGAPQTERGGRFRIGIYNETDKLRSAALWGPIGAEAVLAQVLPPGKSLFYEAMDVVIAREEAAKFAATLEGLGVQTVSVRDRVAAKLSEKPALTPLDLKVQLLAKAARFAAEDLYRPLEIDPATGELEKRREIDLNDISRQIGTLVDADIERYGVGRGVNINQKLCLDEELPLGNSIYARDQMNVLLGTRFVSRMKKPIRGKEVDIYESVYADILGPDTPTAVIPKGETFEGGDAYVHNGTVYVGVGPRTSQGGAEFIYKTLHKQLEAQGLKFAMVVDPDPEGRPQNEQMDFMHLDTFSGPIGDREAAVCEEEAKRRRVIFLETSRFGRLVRIDTGKNFLEHLIDTEDNVIRIPKEEQQEFGCNFLALDQNTLLVPLGTNTSAISQFEAAGKTVIDLDLKESTRGYGASHCMTGQLRRARQEATYA